MATMAHSDTWTEVTEREYTTAYERDRQRHVQARDAQIMAELEKTDWPLERLHALRDERLRAMIHHAKAHSPWHARRLRAVDPGRLSGDDLSMIPPMTKADLMENWDEIVTDRRLTLDLATRHLVRIADHGPAYLLDQYHVVASGGSSGRRGIFVWDYDGWLAGQLSTTRHGVWTCRHLGLESLEPAANVGAASPIHITAAMRGTFGGPPASRHDFPVTLPLAEIVAGLNQTRPIQLFSYPSMLHRLALEQRAGRLHIAPRLLICGAEPLPISARQVIEAVFGAPIIDAYGSSETWVLGISAPGSPNLHLIEDVAVCEPVDQAGRAVQPGQTSAALLVTNVVNRVLPLIRYQLTDEVTFLAESNTGTWAGRRIAPVGGRHDHLFTYAEGITVQPDVFDSALLRLPDLTDYQVRQTPNGADIAVLTRPDAALDGLRSSLTAALKMLGLADPCVSVTAVAHLPRKADTGKLVRFIPLAG
jgi:phenylacetate-coenzyme A ligase PaaK-like adenylate-forming protein